MKLVLGVDIGISSVGWAILDIESEKVIDAGVRLFTEATKKNNEERRSFRGGRRLKRRRSNRKEDLLKLLKKNELFADTNNNYNPYEIRVKGLTQKLSLEELNVALLNICKHRGSSLEVVGDDEAGKTKAVLSANDKALKEGKYVCEVQLARLRTNGKVRGNENNFRTIDYEKELEQILLTQEISEDIRNEIIKIITRRRDFSEGPGSFKSPTPYGPIYDENGNVKVNMIEKMTGKCSIFPDELRAPKYAPSAEFFNLLNDLNNLSINNEKLDVDTKQELIKLAFNKGKITPKDVAKFTENDLSMINGFRVNKKYEPLLTELEGFKLLKKVFTNHGLEMQLNNFNLLDSIAVILTKTKVKEQRIDELKKFDLPANCIEELAELGKFTAYHSLSLKAINIINEEMYNSDLNQMQILTSSNKFEFNRNNGCYKGQKKISINDNAILSPVAMRSYRQAIKVINAVRKKYGELDSIVVETTRDKNSSEQKQRINEIQKHNEEINKMVADKLAKYPKIKPNSKLRDKLRLYEDQLGKSAYTQQPIDIDQLICDPNAYEIDHIIPISISLDDSYNNKVLVTHRENQDKGQLTPYLAFTKNKLNYGSYAQYTAFMKDLYKNKHISKKKLEYALYEADISKYENMKEFIARNLVDTSYANRLVFNTLMNYFKDNDIDTKVHTIKGSATATFRKYIIGLTKDRDIFSHHAVDAMLVASIKKLNLYDKLLRDFSIDEANNVIYNKHTGEIIEANENYLIDENYIKFLNHIVAYPVTKFSWQIDTKPNRSVSDQTIYSTRTYDDKQVIIKKYKDIYDSKFFALADDIMNGKSSRYLAYRNDKQTFEKFEVIVKHYYEEYKGDKKMIDEKKGEIKFKFNPLFKYREETGCLITKYAKHDNGPAITQLKYIDGNLGNHIDISNKYQTKNKKVVLQQISPYRTDFYLDGKTYKFVTVRYCNVFFSQAKQCYTIDKEWYAQQKAKKQISADAKFICSLHHNEYLMIKGTTKELSKEATAFKNDPDQIIWKFTATNNDNTNVIEVKPINFYESKQIMLSIGKKVTSIKKYSCDVLGNLREINDSALKLEFD